MQTAPDEIPAAEPSESALARLVAHLSRRYRARITGRLDSPARPARFSPFPPELEPRLAAALRARGIGQLYSHQR
jgi:DEAD/DEAH box helicase domain-containing protein